MSHRRADNVAELGSLTDISSYRSTRNAWSRFAYETMERCQFRRLLPVSGRSAIGNDQSREESRLSYLADVDRMPSSVSRQRKISDRLKSSDVWLWFSNRCWNDGDVDFDTGMKILNGNRRDRPSSRRDETKQDETGRNETRSV